MSYKQYKNIQVKRDGSIVHFIVVEKVEKGMFWELVLPDMKLREAVAMIGFKGPGMINIIHQHQCVINGNLIIKGMLTAEEAI